MQIYDYEQLLIMSKINRNAKHFVDLCVKCGHNRVSHSKTTFRDEGRANPKTINAYESECTQCKAEGKTCKDFEAKKKGLVDKIKNSFKQV